MSSQQHPWTQAFVAFCNRKTLEDIAQIFGIPLATLRARASSERWLTMRDKIREDMVPTAAALAEDKVIAQVLEAEAPPATAIKEYCTVPAVTGQERDAVAVPRGGPGRSPELVESALPAPMKAKLELIRRNREVNYKVACELRDDLLEVVAKLRSGELTLEKQWHNKGAVTRAEVEPSIVDRVNLATYARTVADLSYRALGDMAMGEKAASDAGAGTGAGAPPPITIILPGAIAGPRERQARKAQVIDLQPLAGESGAE